MDGVLARQTDCSLCCEWEKSPQDSAKVGGISTSILGVKNTKDLENLRSNADIAERSSLECNLSLGQMIRVGDTVVNGDRQKSLCGLQWQSCKAVRCSYIHQIGSVLRQNGCSFVLIPARTVVVRVLLESVRIVRGTLAPLIDSYSMCPSYAALWMGNWWA